MYLCAAVYALLFEHITCVGSPWLTIADYSACSRALDDSLTTSLLIKGLSPVSSFSCELSRPLLLGVFCFGFFPRPLVPFFRFSVFAGADSADRARYAALRPWICIYSAFLFLFFSFFGFCSFFSLFCSFFWVYPCFVPFFRFSLFLFFGLAFFHRSTFDLGIYTDFFGFFWRFFSAYFHLLCPCTCPACARAFFITRYYP